MVYKNYNSLLFEDDPPYYVTVDVSTVKNGKYFPSCYNVTSVTDVKVWDFFLSCQSVCEVIPIHVDVVHVTTNVIVKHLNRMSLCRPKILPAPVTQVENVSTRVNKSCVRLASNVLLHLVGPEPQIQTP